MSIQEIALSNSQKKKLLKIENLEDILFEDDNGELVLNVAAYKTLKKSLNPAPIEAIVGEDKLDYNVEYFVFS